MKQHHTRFNTTTSPLHSLLNGLLKYAAILVMAMMMGLPLTGWGQTTYSWGSSSTNSGTVSHANPFGRCYGWEYRVYLYPPNTLSFAGSITNLEFLPSETLSSSGGQIDVWMKTTTSVTSLSSSTSFATYKSGATHVYSNSSSPSFTANSYVSIPLSTPIAYNYNYNEYLMILVRSVANSTSGDGCKSFYFYNPSGASNNTWYGKNDGSDPGENATSGWGNSGTGAYLPVIRVTYTTGPNYCTPSLSNYSSYYMTGFTTTGGTTNINQSYNSAPSSAYTDLYNSVSLTAAANSTIGFTATTVGTGTYGCAIWIDFNKDGDFADSGERVYVTSSYTDNPSGNFQIPSGTASGNYRMRVMVDFYNSAPSDPCSGSDGEAKDYKLIVTAAPATPSISTKTVSSISYNSATSGGENISGTVTTKGLVWSTKSNPTLSDYNASGYNGGYSTDGSGTSSFNHTMVGLTPGATYYVKAYATNNGNTGYGTARQFATTAADDFSGTLTSDGDNTNISNQHSEWLFNGIDNHKWCANDGNFPYYAIFHADGAIKPVGYKLTTGEDNTSYGDRNPMDWVLYGGNSTSGPWTAIATVSDNHYMQDINHQTYSFGTDSNSTAYQYYKLEIISCQNNNSVMQLAEFSFLVVNHSVSIGTHTNGTLSVNHSSATEGQTVTITAIANANCIISGSPVVTKQGGGTVTVTSIGNDQYTFTMPAENVTVSADFAPLYSLSWSNPTGGTISVTQNGNAVSSGQSFPQNTQFTITATPSSGYAFSGWTATGSPTIANSNSASTTLTMGTDNVVLSASFAQEIIVGDHTGTSTSSELPSQSYYNYTLSQQIYTPCEIGVTGNLSGIAFYNGNYTKTRTYDIYLVTTTKETFSSTTDWITVTASDMVFSGSVTMTAGVWTWIPFSSSFYYDGTSNLAVIMDDNTGSYSSGMACRVYDADGYQALRVRSDGTNYDPLSPSSYTGTQYTVKNQIKFSSNNAVTRTPVYVTVSANDNNYGTVTGGGCFLAGTNTSTTVTATPNSCYKFVNWTKNGSQVSTNASYTFTVTEDVDLVANFEPQVDVNDITVSGTTTLTCGNSTTLTATGLSGVIYNWYSDAACTQLVATGPTLTTPVLTNTTVYYVKAVEENIVEGTPSTFSYIGSVQTYPVPSGYSFLRMEVWGAQSIYSSADPTTSYPSGYGGYATGTMTDLTGVSTLYVYVGGKPGSAVGGSSSYYNGGWNGGGGKPSASSWNDNGPGGGATDICLVQSAVSLSDYRYIRTENSYLSRLIVAGGGGGGRSASSYAAGGYVPGNGIPGSTGYYGTMNAAGTNGSNAIAGGFGYGSSSDASSDDRGCGGGGWYGGGSNGDDYGGGGSSFVWCDAYASYVPTGYTPTASMKMINVDVKSGTQTMPAPGGSTETGHSGDGYARITPYNIVLGCESAAKAVTVTVNPLSADDITVSGTTTITSGNSTTLTATGLSGVIYKWYSDAACTQLVASGPTLNTPALTNTTTYYVKAFSGGAGLDGVEIPYSFTGTYDTYTVPAGVESVKLQVWGAEGGQTNYSSYTWKGGKGGYSEGIMPVNAGDVLYVYVGGKGGNGSTGAGGPVTGGWNGGGSSGSSTSYFYGGAGGGGTDIRVNNNSLYARVIAAGGGGGAYGTQTNVEVAGGHGGGLSGTQGTYYSSYTGRRGGAASQTTGGAAGTGGTAGTGYAGAFGVGGNSNTGQASGGGGGGGWYGGGGGADGAECAGVGGGGSGFIWTAAYAANYPSGCLLTSAYYLADAQTIAGNASMPDPNGGTMTGREGDGFARITLNAVPSCESDAKAVTVTVQCTLSVSTSPSGSGFTATGGGTYEAGTSHTVNTSTTNSNYVFAFWWNEGTSTVASTNASFSYGPLNSNTTLVAYYAPLSIANATQWAEFSTVINRGFSYSGRTVPLTADINLSGYTGGPAGTGTNPFQGSFDGNGHCITNYSSSNVTHNGLFGYVSGSGNISNVIVNATLSGTTTSVGAVVGTFASSGTISNVEGAGTISSSSTNAGGLVGNMTSGTIHSSFTVATLSGSATNKGGLVGRNSGNLYNCYSNASYSNGTNKGGLVGNNSGTVENCYAAGIVSGVYAFAATNSGTIRYCYADAQGSGLASGNAPVGSGLFGAVQSDIKHVDYMFRDNIVPANTNTYVGGSGVTSYVGNHIPVWNGLLSALNQWVRANPRSISDLTSWHRPMTTNINGDLPVLAFPKDNSLGTLNSDGKFLRYGSNQSNATGIDALLTTYNGGAAASIFHYGRSSGVTGVPSSNVHVYVQEDAVLLQTTSSPGNFINTTVGVTFDNSDHGQHAFDFWGNRLNYDWHLMSTPLRDAKIGTLYSSYSASGDPNSPIDISSMVNSYFPNGLPMALHQSIKWDFYSYYEPDYHWINLKRNKNNHYHQDGGAHITYNQSDQADSDLASADCMFLPGKGYMMAISQNTFMNQSGTLNHGDVPITLTNQEPDGEHYSKGWNLVGNPYQAYLDLEAMNRLPVYIYDAEQGIYVPYAKESSSNPVLPSQYIHPHQAFFMHAEPTTPATTEAFTFQQAWATTDSNAASYFRDEHLDYPLVNLFAENSIGQRDLTVVEFHRPEIGGAPKLDAMRNMPFTLAAHHNGTAYGILFSTDDMERIPVHFKTDEDDQMTITWSIYNGEFSQLHLFDNLLGVNYDMLNHDSYTFTARASDYASRFYITYECTGVDEDDDSGGPGGGSFAYVSHGNIVVDVTTGSGTSLQLVDMLGRVLYSTVCTDGVHTISTNGLAKGVYLIRLTTNKSVRTQKLIVQ